MPCPSDCSLAQMAAMSPLQLMRAVIAALASPATFAKGLVMARRQPDAAAAQLPPLSSASAFRQHHPVVFVDPSGHVNLAVNVQRSGLAQVHTDARGLLQY